MLHCVIFTYMEKTPILIAELRWYSTTGSPNYLPRATFGPRSPFTQPQREFVANEKITCLRNICWSGSSSIFRNNHITKDVRPSNCCV